MRITKANVKYNSERKLEIVKEMSLNYGKIQRLDTPSEVTRLMLDVFDLGNEPEEHVYLLALNSQMKCRAIFEVSKGTENESLVSQRIIFRDLLLTDANRFILVHNHPSGETEPSIPDKKVTENIKNGAKLLGLDFLDHIIVGTKIYSWYSFHENGYL